MKRTIVAYKEHPMVTEQMREAGAQIASDLIDAQVSKHMGGLGGSKEWDEFVSAHSGKNMDLIKKYVDGEIDSVSAIYIAMTREVLTPNPQLARRDLTSA